ncbi:MAG: nucleoside monophosphate kinase [Patescibacteria group bacterium]
MPRVIIFIGPPGSGKGTQAMLLVDRFEGYRHFDLGRAIELKVYDPQYQDDPVVRTERERFEKGLLTTPSWVQGIIREEMERIAHSGYGILSSGAPRTREDAEMMLPLLTQIYGDGSIAVLHILVSKETSIFRNMHRRICKRCGKALLWSQENEQLTYCPVCGGELVARSLDKSDVIEVRWHEYEHLTESILPLFTAFGIPIFDIQGDQPPEKVYADIVKALQGNSV